MMLAAFSVAGMTDILNERVKAVLAVLINGWRSSSSWYGGHRLAAPVS